MYTIILLLTSLAGAILETPLTGTETTSNYYFYESEIHDSEDLTLIKEECFSGGFYYYVPETDNSNIFTIIKEQLK
ncbi:MAG: hypothetical protein NC225_08785 [Clostridium sp.]|nr:hypothetical protein [Clostridium sp.]MCM1460113.1 hypothetical protein [Bacteroides sp.]